MQTIQSINFLSIAERFFSKYSTVFIVFLCLLCGGLLRTGSLALFTDSPDLIFLNGSPLLTDLDAYYYLNNAKLLFENAYPLIDHQRVYPEGVALPQPAPLLSYMVAFLAKISNLNINWIGFILPPLLSLLIAIPVYSLGLHWGGRIMASFSVLITLLAYIYATRTAVGMLDTDCLNVTFPLLISVAFLKFGILASNKRYYYFVGGLLLFILFLWWWDMAPSVVILFTLFPLMVALTFFYRPGKKERIVFFLFLALSVLTVIYSLGLDYFVKQVKSFQTMFLYITKNGQFTNSLPSTGVSNLEQEALTLFEAAVNTIGNVPLFILSLIGLLFLFIKKAKEFLYILPIVVVGLFAFTSVRFLIFLVPLTGLGFGYLLSMLYKYFPVKLISIAVLVVLAVFFVVRSLSDPPIRTTFYKPQVIEGMIRAGTLTPPNAVIYSWWDGGHPLVFWSGRATLADGYIHGSERTIYLGIPFTTDNFQFCANYIQFFTTRGVIGINSLYKTLDLDQKNGIAFIKSVLSSGPKEGLNIINGSVLKDTPPPVSLTSWLDFFFPNDAPPIYLFIEDRLLKPTIQRWLYWYGTWDTEKMSGDTTLPTIQISPLQEYNKGTLKTSRLDLDEDTGSLGMDQAFQEPISLSRLTVFNNDGTHIMDYASQSDQRKTTPRFLPSYIFGDSEIKYFSASGQYSLEILPFPLFSYLQDVKLVDTLQKKLFLYKSSLAKEYFELIDEQHLIYQIWKVKGEKATLQ